MSEATGPSALTPPSHSWPKMPPHWKGIRPATAAAISANAADCSAITAHGSPLSACIARGQVYQSYRSSSSSMSASSKAPCGGCTALKKWIGTTNGPRCHSTGKIGNGTSSLAPSMSHNSETDRTAAVCGSSPGSWAMKGSRMPRQAGGESSERTSTQRQPRTTRAATSAGASPSAVAPTAEESASSWVSSAASKCEASSTSARYCLEPGSILTDK
mmetsp:Transcript_83504/g.255223  ORF Transcript_83504/g.255223 Transcript_83504/m.255223 type:complete len:216 (-) Transcript_83504:378-1025(-)